jgi:NAD-dependent deacetylase
MRREKVFEVDPNPGHFTLAQMEPVFERFTLVTQNVDGLHQRAGSKNVVELHGNILRNFCVDCGKEDARPEINKDETLQHCQSCSGLIRPGVVWFGEALPEEAIEAAVNAAADCDFCFSIGTSAVVYPAASIPQVAKGYGAQFCEINPNRTPLSDAADWFLAGPSGEILPQILAAYQQLAGT